MITYGDLSGHLGEMKTLHGHLSDVQAMNGQIEKEQNFYGMLDQGSLALRGYSAYEIAVQEGFVGTVDEWLESLKGDAVVLKSEDGVIYWKYSKEDDTAWRYLFNLGEDISYSQLKDKPHINGIELSGDKTSEELGLADSGTEQRSKIYTDSLLTWNEF